MLKAIKKITISSDNLQDFLGVKKLGMVKLKEKNLIGIATGLAYTDFGGDILAIEAVLMPGKEEDKHRTSWRSYERVNSSSGILCKI